MQHSKSKWLAFIIGVILCTGSSTPGLGATKQDELKQIERDIREEKKRSTDLKSKSENLKAEAEALRAELIALSQSVQQREANVTRLEIALEELAREENTARQDLEKRHGQSVDTLMALQRLALNPPEALIASPQEPADMVRSAILLRSLVPQIQQEADLLRRDVENYAQKRKLLQSRKESLDRANLNLDDERRRLDLLIKEKNNLSKRYVADSQAARKKANQLSAKARSLRELLKRLETERKAQEKRDQEKAARDKAKQKQTPKDDGDNDESEIVLGKPPTGKPIAKSKGELSRPAAGPIVMKYGAKEKLGGKHKGISIKTRTSAQIVATYDGQIAFAGPFRGYKQLLIIDHGDGYHTLLTGMDRIDVSEGQWLLSGEPVGVMSSNRSSDATLYFELRKNGAPINPLPWLRRQNAKARG
ncbi:MAG: peptidoglycan DD-metalloendopeptidase family protein [Methylocystaceae bacterium]|nr:peptidoglycan DD-metalloendopeptidase family protein [Methylocystaceae bacterium]